MTNYNEDYNSGDVNNGIINVVIEIPFGSVEKIEWNSKTYEMEVDRQEPSEFSEPANYGFVPGTIGGDGDALDAMIICDDSLESGSVHPARVIGVMKFTDENEVDDKIIAVPIDSNVDWLSNRQIDELTYYFNHYKDYKQLNDTSVLGFEHFEPAMKVVADSIAKWQSKV